MNHGTERALRGALRQLRGALTLHNRAMQDADIPADRRRVMTATRSVLLEVEAVYVAELASAVAESSERRAA